jgi:hypothetical protein
MSIEFADIRIVGLDEEHTTRADPSEPLYDVRFVLSATAPVRWMRFAQALIGRTGIAGRRGWPQAKCMVVRCAVAEVEQALAALGPILGAANRQYRAWAATEARVRAADEAWDRGERQKLRELVARLAFGEELRR